MSIFDLLSVLLGLSAAVFAFALGTPLLGAVIGGLFAGICLKGCFWILQRLDRRSS